MAQVGIYPRFRADDFDGNPLSGGKLYFYASGSDDPEAVYADPELTQAMPQPVVLNASGEALFYYSGSTYRAVLTDKDDVQQWSLDPITAGLGGTTGIVGMGIGSNTMLIEPDSGTAQASAVVFPADTLAIAVTVIIHEAFGTSQGLEQIGLGHAAQPDLWGILPRLTPPEDSTPGGFLAYSGVPQPQTGPVRSVTLTAYGGPFDGAGSVYVTGHFFRFSPNQDVGLRYLPGSVSEGMVIPPQPLATETVAGIVELATQAEVDTGTDATRVVTPATLTSKLPSGTALTVARFQADGSGVQTAPGLFAPDTGRLGIGVTPESGQALQVQGATRVRQGNYTAFRDDGAPVGLYQTVYSDTVTNGAQIQGTHGGGTEAAPTATPAGAALLSIQARGHMGTGGAPGFSAEWLVEATETVSSTTQGSRVRLLTTLTGAVGRAERLRVDGNGYLGVSKPAPLFPLHVGGRLAFGVPTTAPNLPDLAASETSAWLDEATHRLMFRTKYADGTTSRTFIADEGSLGTFAFTTLGFAVTAPSGTVTFWQRGSLVMLHIPTISGTSSSNSFGIDGLPVGLRPPIRTSTIPLVITDNGVKAMGFIGIANSATMFLGRDAAGTPWTTTGTKGMTAITVTYML